MTEVIVHPGPAPDAVADLRQVVNERIDQSFVKHSSYVQESLGMACLLVARRRQGLVEMHGIIKNSAYNTLIIESHYQSTDEEAGFDYDKIPTKEEVEFIPDPDAGCEHTFMSSTDMLHTQLTTGMDWPAIVPVVGNYALLGRRFNVLTKRRPQLPYRVSPKAVKPILREMVGQHGHRIHHPALQQLPIVRRLMSAAGQRSNA